MNIVILDDYQDAVRKLKCASKLEEYPAKVYTNTIKGIGNLKHGAWQQSGMKSASMPPNFGLGLVLRGRTLGIWGYGKIGQLVAGYGKAFGMRVIVWGSQSSRSHAESDGLQAAASREELFQESDVLSLHLRMSDETSGI